VTTKRKGKKTPIFPEKGYSRKNQRGEPGKIAKKNARVGPDSRKNNGRGKREYEKRKKTAIKGGSGKEKPLRVQFRQDRDSPCRNLRETGHLGGRF